MIKRKLLVNTQALTASSDIIYTVDTGLSAQVTGCTIHNPTDAPITVIVNFADKVQIEPEPQMQSAPETTDETTPEAVEPQTQSADSSNQILKRTLQDGESYACPELVNHTLSESMSILAAGAGATITVSGVTFT